MKREPENEKLPYPGETINLSFIVISLSAASSSRPRESGRTPGGTEGPNIGPFHISCTRYRGAYYQTSSQWYVKEQAHTLHVRVIGSGKCGEVED